jgi:hypothetical protein
MIEEFPVQAYISLYAIPEEFAQDDALFEYWWMPETAIGEDGLSYIVRPARISEEAKAGRLVVPPVHNLITNAGITRMLLNQSVTAQGSMQPIAQILSVGNGTLSGVTRSDTAVIGDAFTTGARKAPASNNQVGFLTTIITNFASGDAVGTWSNMGWYGGGSATTSAGTGVLYSHALFGFSKGSTAYSVNYSWLLGN